MRRAPSQEGEQLEEVVQVQVQGGETSAAEWECEVGWCQQAGEEHPTVSPPSPAWSLPVT